MGEIQKEGDAIARNFPEVQPHAVGEPASKQARKDYSHLRDRAGRAFDPAIHWTQPDGTPKVSSAGRLRGIPGRPLPAAAKSEAALPPTPRSEVPQAATPEAKPAEEIGSEFVTTAAAVVESIVAVLVMLLGADWQLRTGKVGGVKVDERAGMTRAWALYFKARGISDIPPEWMLATVMLGYAGPRFTQEATRSKFSRGWAKMKGWAGNRRGTRTSVGNDTIRKDHLGKASGG